MGFEKLGSLGCLKRSTLKTEKTNTSHDGDTAPTGCLKDSLQKALYKNLVMDYTELIHDSGTFPGQIIRTG